jgi:uncharacterized membrane protein YjgN (DUF898 family)
MDAPVIVGDAERRMAARGGVRDLPVEFHGNAQEYFGIWIVNILLSIVTVGVWSAWAKVRTKRYFYGNTEIDTHAFEYHATGYQIFKGRLIAFGVFVGLSLADAFAPLISWALWLGVFALVPWVINRSLRFNARVTSWRNVRFDFTGSYWRTLLIFLVLPFAIAASLGVFAPYASRLRARYLYGGHSYDGVAFEADPRLGALYHALGAAAVFGAAWLVVFGGLAVLTVPLLMGFGREVPVAFLPIVPALLVVTVASLFYGARVRNEAIGRMSLAEHRFRCDLSGMRYAWIVVSGLLATILTLGLLRPWAHVRQWRYVASAIGVLAVGDLDGFVAERVDAGSSFATEFGEMEGFDIGF